MPHKTYTIVRLTMQKHLAKLPGRRFSEQGHDHPRVFERELKVRTGAGRDVRAAKKNLEKWLMDRPLSKRQDTSKQLRQIPQQGQYKFPP